MRVVVDGRVHEGRAVDLDGTVAARELAAAIRDGHDRITVDCPDPGRVHEHVGLVSDDASIRPRTALAMAARSRGLSTPEDERRRRVRERLQALSTPEVDGRAARKRVAEAGSDVQRLRERVAELRGRLDAGDDVAEADLRAAIRELSERETERVAAREELTAVRREQREARAVRRRRLELQDRMENLARTARSKLVDRLRSDFAAAVAAARRIASEPPSGPSADPFDAESVTVALAVARLADVNAPLVLDCDRFETAAEAAAWLDAPVVRP